MKGFVIESLYMAGNFACFRQCDDESTKCISRFMCDVCHVNELETGVQYWTPLPSMP